MSIPHDPLCGVFSMARGFCDMDCAKREGDASWQHPPGFQRHEPRVLGDDEALLNGGRVSHHEREGMIVRLIAHHENSFAQLAMDQARLLRDELPDRVTMEALNRMMARHAAILAELRR